MSGAFNTPKLFWRIGERKEFLAEAEGHNTILGSVYDQRRGLDRAD